MILLDLGAPNAGHPEPARVVPRHMNTRPQPDRDPPAEVLAKVAVSAAIAAKDAVDAELFTVVRIGLMLSSGRPGVKKLMFVLTDRTNPKRKTECSLATTVAGEHLLLVADCLGRTEEVGRVALADGGAAGAVRSTVERFVLETADRFAHPVAK